MKIKTGIKFNYSGDESNLSGVVTITKIEQTKFGQMVTIEFDDGRKSRRVDAVAFQYGHRFEQIKGA